MNSLISIIMPVYNAEKFVAEAINSVLKQTYANWELLIINDGSVDGSEQVIKIFNDNRIRFFYQSNQGVSAARNVGLKNMKGDYFCFLDADDVFPENSVLSRHQIFIQNPETIFVDGKVEKWDSNFGNLKSTWTPCMMGNPLIDLISLEGKSFFGPTWMIRRGNNKEYQMREGLTHGEDLLFYIDIAALGGTYSFTNDLILLYRVHSQSAMQNLDALNVGYLTIHRILSSNTKISKSLLSRYRNKVRRIMFLSYLRKIKIFQALKSLI
jgi:glycosyltransferase involved in cell wall biosynthesis